MGAAMAGFVWPQSFCAGQLPTGMRFSPLITTRTWATQGRRGGSEGGAAAGQCTGPRVAIARRCKIAYLHTDASNSWATHELRQCGRFAPEQQINDAASWRGTSTRMRASGYPDDSGTARKGGWLVGAPMGAGSPQHRHTLLSVKILH